MNEDPENGFYEVVIDILNKDGEKRIYDSYYAAESCPF